MGRFSVVRVTMLGPSSSLMDGTLEETERLFQSHFAVWESVAWEGSKCRPEEGARHHLWGSPLMMLLWSSCNVRNKPPASSFPFEALFRLPALSLCLTRPDWTRRLFWSLKSHKPLETRFLQGGQKPLWGESNRVWTNVFECEQLQIQSSVLTVSGVTLPTGDHTRTYSNVALSST